MRQIDWRMLGTILLVFLAAAVAGNWFLGTSPNGGGLERLVVNSVVPELSLEVSTDSVVSLHNVLANEACTALVVSWTGCGGCQAVLIEARRAEASMKTPIPVETIVLAEGWDAFRQATRGLGDYGRVFRLPVETWASLTQRVVPLVAIISSDSRLLWVASGPDAVDEALLAIESLTTAPNRCVPAPGSSTEVPSH